VRRFEGARFARAKLAQLALTGARPFVENNKGVRRLAPFFMRESDDRNLAARGCLKSTLSTSTEEMFSPPLIITSFRRSRIST